MSGHTEVAAPAPERIYLQDGCDQPQCGSERCQELSGAYEGITWCEDRIHDNDTEYVRADLCRSVTTDLLEAAHGVDTLYAELHDAMPALVGTPAYDAVQNAVTRARAAIRKATEAS